MFLTNIAVGVNLDSTESLLFLGKMFSKRMSSVGNILAKIPT
jgi:hypothetical protein